MAEYETYPRSLWHSVRTERSMEEEKTNSVSSLEATAPAVVLNQPTTEEPRKRNKTNRRSTRSDVDRQKMEAYRNQELKRAPKVQIDQRVVLWSWIVGVAVAFISSAIVSFNGITSVAFFVGLSQDWMAGLFFFFIELMYLLFLIAYLVLASRLDEDGKPEKTWGSIAGMVVFGGIAVLANAFHTLDYWDWSWVEPRMWAGIILSISAPIAIISASKMASRVVFAKAIKL